MFKESIKKSLLSCKPLMILKYSSHIDYMYLFIVLKNLFSKAVYKVKAGIC